MAGEIYDNPVTGEHVTVIESPEDHGGKFALVELRVSPGGAVAQAHLHDTLEESFEVLEGKVGFLLGDHTVTLGPGESAEVREGLVHDWWNAGEGEARVIVRLEPGPHGNPQTVERFRDMVLTIFALAHQGKTNDKGMPGILQASLIALDHADIIRFTKPPRFVQRTLFGLLAPIARARGLSGTVAYENPGQLDAEELAKLRASTQLS